MKQVKQMQEHRKQQAYLLGFSDVFPAEKRPSIESLLGRASRQETILLGAFFLGLNPSNSNYSNLDLLSKFTSENNKFANYVYSRIIMVEKSQNTPVALIYPISCLQLFEFAFQNLGENYVLSDSEFEKNIFIALLEFNERNREKFDSYAIKSIGDMKGELRYPAFSVASNFFQFEYLNFLPAEVFVTQMIKAIYLFRFLSQERTQSLLNAFFKRFGRESWEDYLKSYLPLAISILTKKKEGHLDIIVIPGDSFEKDCAFLDMHSLEENEEFDGFDFKKTRATPFCKIEEGKYRVIYHLFALEKIFTGVYFLLKEVNERLVLPDKIPDLRRLFTSDFSEEYLLYKVNAQCFPKKWIHLSGKEMRLQGMNAEPDYYIRFKNKVFLFENKDNLINAEVKESCDFQLLEPELAKRFRYETTSKGVKNGAVRQISQNIRRILNNNFQADSNLIHATVAIYPILVVHYNQFNTVGLNKFVNGWFQEELEILKAEGLEITNVWPLTIVFIDTLIIYQDYLLSRQLRLEDLIKKYWELNEVATYIEPFSIFLAKECHKKKFLKSPKILKKFGLSLF